MLGLKRGFWMGWREGEEGKEGHSIAFGHDHGSWMKRREERSIVHSMSIQPMRAP